MKNFYSNPFKSVLIFYFGLLSIFLNAQNYYADFKDATNPSDYNDNVNFSLGNQPWLASARYHSGSDFRLGKNSSAVVPSKFIATTPQGASVEMKWDIAYPKSISLATSTSYGTPREWSIYESIDQGISWQLVNAQNYTSNSEWYTINITPKPLARYAFVITGISNPRVRLNQIKIEVETPINQVPELELNARLIQGNYGEPIVFPLRFKNYPTAIVVDEISSFGLNYNSDRQEITGSPAVVGEFPIQVQASNAYGTSPLETLTLKTNKGNQSVNALSDLTLAYNLLSYTLPVATNQGMPLTYVSSNPALGTIVGNVLNFAGVGTFNVTLTAPENEYYQPFSRTISVRINKGTQSLATEINDIIGRIEDRILLNLNTTQQGELLRFSTLNSSVATVTDNQLHLINPGRTTLKIEADQTSTYNAFSREVMVEVVNSSTCYYENFSSKVIPNQWIGTNANFANGYLNFGSHTGNVVFPAPENAKTLIFDLERSSTVTERVFNVLVSEDNVVFQNVASYNVQNTDLQQTITLDLSTFSNIGWIKLEKVSSTISYWRVDNLKIECQPQRVTTIWQNGNWSNGLPDQDKIVIIQESYEITNGMLEAFTLTIEPSGSLVVKANNVLKVISKITNQGNANQLIVEDQGQVIQQESIANEGESIVYKRSRPMYRNDMTIWSSPVTGQYIRAFSPETLYYRIWDYDESTTNYRPIFSEDHLTDQLFEAGKGIAIRVRNTLPTNNVEEKLGAFQGVLNNDMYAIATTRIQSGFNLIGNPYASALALDGPNGFFAQNPQVTQLFLWTPFFRTSDENFGNNYITITRAGAVGPYSDNPRTIASGQGFFVQVEAPVTVYINSAMRTLGSSLFYRNSSVSEDQFYLKLSKQGNTVNRQLIHYSESSTKGFDAQWDAQSVETGGTKSYSLMNEKAYSIQSRGVFEVTDQIPIGYQTSTAGELQFSSEDLKGIFSTGQSIYLYDKMLDIYHLISESPYVFYSEAGIFDSRFQIVYQSHFLNTSEIEKYLIVVYTDQNYLIVDAKDQLIHQYTLFSIDGKRIVSDSNYNRRRLKKHLQKGIYILSLEVNEKIENYKIIIR